MNSHRSPTRITIQDEIDGRGIFFAKDLEKELRSMHRSELEDQLGISWTKVRDIIRRSDYDRDGIVEYKDFLETVQNYRLNTEQTSTLKSLVRAFAYAEEYSCWPPRWFMIGITGRWLRSTGVVWSDIFVYCIYPQRLLFRF